MSGVTQQVAPGDHQALVDAIAARVTAAVLQRLGPPTPAARRLSQADHEALTRLLPAAWRACGISTFATVDLIERAKLHPELAAATIRLSGKSLGRLLHRAATCAAAVGGLTVHRLGSSRDGALWGLGYVPTTTAGDVTFRATAAREKPTSDETRRGRSATMSA